MELLINREVLVVKEILIDRNEHNQRIDRFLKKYLPDASLSFIYKMLRKKNIKLNGSKAKPEDIIKENDTIQLYLSDETINKFMARPKEIIKAKDINIIYEDDNIVLINKPKGILSHGTGKNYENNVVDSLISYLYEKKEYNPRLEKTFTPSICNRLDRNTSGIIIGAKNFTALQLINEAIRDGQIKRYYKCIVKGNIEKGKELKGFLTKDEEKNEVQITQRMVEGSKEIHTIVNPIITNGQYSLIEIDLITGRTHQIRAHLSSIGHPIVGDIKYGSKQINEKFKREFNLRSQFLYAYKVEFKGLKDSLEYLNGKGFVVQGDEELINIEKNLFNKL